MTGRVPGQILAERMKGCITWQARISTDRLRLEIVGIVPPSSTPTTIELLSEHELLELLGEGAELHDDQLSRSELTSDPRGNHER